MKRYGLIGRPLGHSFSAGYFAAKFRREGITGCDYALYELPSIEALPELLGTQPELQGFNVTIPYNSGFSTIWTTCRKRPHGSGP